MKIFNFRKIFLSIICIMCINFQNFTKQNTRTNNNIKKTLSPINNISMFQSGENISLIYNQKGELKCKIITKYIQYLNNTKTIYFIKPTATLFENNIPIWNIQAKQAKITNKKNMFLNGNVKINSLIYDTYIQSITTNTATLNLITYNVYTNEKINIYGTYFYTTATKMQCNLHTRITELSNNVCTLYETKHSKKI